MASTTVQSTTDNGADSHSSSTNQRGTGQTASPGRYGLGRRRCRAAFAYVALACSCSAAGVVPRAGAAAGPQQATPATEAEAGNDGVNGRKYVLRSGGNRSRRILAEKREALPPQCDGRQGQNDARLVYLDLGVNWANTLRLKRSKHNCRKENTFLLSSTTSTSSANPHEHVMCSTYCKGKDCLKKGRKTGAVCYRCA